jgi:large subunit ribosomal protein L19
MFMVKSVKGTKREPMVRTNLPLCSGQVVKVFQKIQEGNKERIQVFEGLVIDVKNKQGVNYIFTVRKVVDGVGVEKIFTAQSPQIEKVEIIRMAKVRRANLSYVRGRAGKAARMKEEMVYAVLGGKNESPLPVATTVEGAEVKAS